MLHSPPLFKENKKTQQEEHGKMLTRRRHDDSAGYILLKPQYIAHQTRLSSSLFSQHDANAIRLHVGRVEPFQVVFN